MTPSPSVPPAFSFDAGGLALELARHTQNQCSGYWRIEANAHPTPIDQANSVQNSSNQPFKSTSIYLVVSSGRLVFAGPQKLSWESLLAELQRYNPKLRNPEYEAAWQAVQQSRAQGKPLSVCMSRLILVDRILDYRGLNTTIRQSFLNQVDRFQSLSGLATFTTDPSVSAERPIVGLSLNELQVEIEQRAQIWQVLATNIPSIDHIPTLQAGAIEQITIEEPETQRILALTHQQRSLAQIAADLGEEDLEIAQRLVPLTQRGLIIWQKPLQPDPIPSDITSVDVAPVEPAPVEPAPVEPAPVEPAPVEVAPINTAAINTAPINTAPINTAAIVSPQPQSMGEPIALASAPHTPRASQVQTMPAICIVDDSQMMLKQFEALVSTEGYRVTTVDDPLRAIPTMLRNLPDVIFLDVNMPDMSGFQLIRAIRLQPELTGIPIIVLTAEKSFSNQQRARWSKCKFLPKPLKPQDLETFRTNLTTILQEVAPSTAAAS